MLRRHAKGQSDQSKMRVWGLIGSIFILTLLIGFIGCGKLSDDTGRPSSPIGTSGGSPVPVGPKSAVGTHSFTVTAAPTSLPADSVNFSTLTATLSDSSGRSVQGYTVAFETQSGNIGWFLDTTSGVFVTAEQQITDSKGQATVRLYGVHSGTEVVNVSVDLDLDGIADLSMIVSVLFTSGGPPSAAGSYSLSLWADPSSVPADMATPSTVVATVTDQWGGAVQNIQINFTAELGYLVNDITSTAFSTEATTTTNQNGSVSLYYFGQTAGSAVITAKATIPDLFGVLTKTTVITVTGGTPVLGVVTIEMFVQYPNNKDDMNVGEKATIVARVTNPDGRPVPGASVLFSTSLGEVDPAIVKTDSAGYARTTFESETSGTATVYATVDYVGGSITEMVADVIVNEAVGTIVVAAPATTTVTLGLNASVEATLTATATVKNANGDFLSGVTVAFSVTSSCSNVTFSPTSTSAATDTGGLARYEFTATGTALGTCNYTVRAAASGQEDSASSSITVN